MKFISIALAAVAAASLSTTAAAQEKVVLQSGKKFDVTEIEVKVGESVRFQNGDPFYHNVFSLSDVQSFDLGSYPKGESKSVVFEKAGVVDVECAIHPNMQMKVTVTE
jgi:plastocyanin